jgi:hypothetical protein
MPQQPNLTAGPTSTDLFEYLARTTWLRLQYGEKFDISQGEETITDINLLEMKIANVPNLSVWKCPKELEKQNGIDWEWWIGSKSLGWIGYAVQAKKFDRKSRRYKGLDHKVRDRANPGHKVLQEQLLENYAYNGQIKRIPLYCFYNYVDSSELAKLKVPNYWHCIQQYDEEQLGCTVTPLRVVKRALSQKGKHRARSFEAIHFDQSTLPWRCVVGCSQVYDLYEAGSGTESLFGPFQVYREVPPIVRKVVTADANADEQSQIQARRILIAPFND